ncbi:Ff.00g038770.m01.CDS01 [Fusarium sp. VM40]|nr:Ff.00g038770.m01.CDS01 [Fusarium sp. VM40]
MLTADYPSLARGETTKGLIVQLIHEKLVSVSLLRGIDQPRACITGPDDKKRWMALPIREISCLSKHFRPNDFGVPVALYYDGAQVTEDDPGSIFDFASSWIDCDEQTKSEIAEELRNSSRMLEKWMMLVSDAPMLNINSSLLDWERCLVLHQTCFASSLLSPETPDDIPGLLNPALSFVAVPRSSVRLFGPF